MAGSERLNAVGGAPTTVMAYSAYTGICTYHGVGMALTARRSCYVCTVWVYSLCPLQSPSPSQSMLLAEGSQKRHSSRSELHAQDARARHGTASVVGPRPRFQALSTGLASKGSAAAMTAMPRNPMPRSHQPHTRSRQPLLATLPEAFFGAAFAQRASLSRCTTRAVHPTRRSLWQRKSAGSPQIRTP